MNDTHELLKKASIATYNKSPYTQPLKKPSLLETSSISPKKRILYGYKNNNGLGLRNNSNLNGLDKLPLTLRAFVDQESHIAECFRQLRAKVLARNKDERPRTILVTSPQPMDGKTTVTAGLAISIAQGVNESVLMLDGDFRKPSLANYFGLRPTSGLSKYLAGNSTLANSIIKTPVNRLMLLPAGPCPENPSELLSSHQMETLIQRLTMRYTDLYILIDSPPVHLASEMDFLISIVDGVLLVVRSQATEKSLVLEALETIGREKLLGVVYNGCSESPRPYKKYKK